MDIFKKILLFFKSLILNGLFTILPIAATIFFVQFIYRTLKYWTLPLHDLIPEILQQIPGSEIILILAFLFLTGVLLKLFLIESIVSFFEDIIDKIPLIRTVYSSFKTLFDFFNVPDPAKDQKKVVLIQFPRKGYYSLAFLLGSAENNFSKIIPSDSEETFNVNVNTEKETKKYFRIFMPGSPNPTTGFFLILPEDEITHTNVTFEEAIKTIVSCGLIAPETLCHLKQQK